MTQVKDVLTHDTCDFFVGTSGKRVSFLGSPAEQIRLWPMQVSACCTRPWSASEAQGGESGDLRTCADIFCISSLWAQCSQHNSKKYLISAVVIYFRLVRLSEIVALSRQMVTCLAQENSRCRLT